MSQRATFPVVQAPQREVSCFLHQRLALLQNLIFSTEASPVKLFPQALFSSCPALRWAGVSGAPLQYQPAPKPTGMLTLIHALCPKVTLGAPHHLAGAGVRPTSSQVVQPTLPHLNPWNVAPKSILGKSWSHLSSHTHSIYVISGWAVIAAKQFTSR